MLQGVDNGIGATTTITYASSASYWADDVAQGRPWKTAMPSPQRVVAAVTATDSVTGYTLATTFRYHHGAWDGGEREFRGFACVEQLDTEADPGEPAPIAQARRVRWYHVGLDVDLLSEYVALPEGSLQHSVPPVHDALRALRGLTVREEVFAEDGDPLPYAVSQTAFRVFPAGRGSNGRRAFAPLPVVSRSTHCERTRERRVVDTTTTWDLHSGTGYGLAVKVEEKGYARTGAFSTPHEQQQAEDLERYTTTTYVGRDVADTDWTGTYTPNYVVGRPSVIEQFEVTGSGDVLIGREKRFYDGAAFQGLGYPGSGTSAGCTHGKLHCRLVFALTDSLISSTFPAGSGAPAARSARGDYLADGTDYYIQAERFQYTSEGLVSIFRDAGGNDLTFTYDSTWDLFPVSAEDAGGYPTTLTRGELPFQVDEVEDANANHTTFGYDASGLPAWRAVKGKFDNLHASAWDGDDDSNPTEEYEYDFSIQPIQVLTKVRQVRQGATLSIYRYIDGLGRALQERHTAEPDPAAPSTPRYRVTGWIEYNHKGLPYRRHQPSFSGSSAFAEPAATSYVQLTYDPLGRPVRIDHPDGTYEATTFHPWYQVFADRNDNAADILASDARYGGLRKRFASHVNTPTVTFVDALGRPIAVSEDNGVHAQPEKTFRITTYTIAAGTFTTSSYDLQLNQALSPNYFVIVSGTANIAAATPDLAAVRVTQDPFGTGDLTASSAEDVIRLERSGSSQDWIGTVTVWECLGDEEASGFTLLDVTKIAASTESSSGTTKSTVETANSSWTSADLAQIVVYGGPRGGGALCSSSTASDFPSVVGKLTPSGTNTLTLERRHGTAGLVAADFTVYVVKWGAEHSIQRVSVSGSAGGDGADVSTEYDSQTISEVERVHTWCWMSGWCDGASIGEGWFGLVCALGNGEDVNETETSVAVGSERTEERDCLVSVHSHPLLDVHWTFKTDADAGEPHTHDVATNLAAETRDEVSSVKSTAGTRLGFQTQTSAGTSTAQMSKVLWWGRHKDDADLVVDRHTGGAAWAAWTQSVETAQVEHSLTRVDEASEPALRVTTYEIGSGEFPNATYTLDLNNPLARHYFVMVLGVNAGSTATAEASGVRVTADPYGTGELDESGNVSQLLLARGANTDDWEGTVVVVESLVDEDHAGFRLVDVLQATVSGGTQDAEDTDTVTCAGWDDLNQVALYGGPRGGGSTVASGNQLHFSSLAAMLTPSGDEDIEIARYSVDRALQAATFTIFVVEWGRQHTIQRVELTGTAGGTDVDDTADYGTATIDTVTRAETWLWVSGWSAQDGMGDSFFGQVAALGNGVDVNATETSVAVGCHESVDRSVLVTVHSHPDLSVEWAFKGMGNAAVSTWAYTVTSPTQEETRDNVSDPATTEGSRFGLQTNAMSSGTGASAFDAALWNLRATADTTMTARRAASGKNWAAWAQAVDAGGVLHRRHHVTRTVFDLRDQPTEVWDARGLADATWKFTYDYAGQRIKTEHTTGTGVRYALADAAGNPIWSRDARAVEVDREFDDLNRPTKESSDDGTIKVRRVWAYMPYDTGDPDFATWQDKNLLGRVEEARDADGLRFFEYDWRGLVTKATHHFWEQKDGSSRTWDDVNHTMWNGTWDPAVDDSNPRSSFTWLQLEKLTTPSKIEVDTTYDAAGRVTQVDYPMSMTVTRAYNEAGLLKECNVDDGTTAAGVSGCEYNARGQVTKFTHDNNVVTEREYDGDLERLTRLFTRLTVTGTSRYQDLRYDYDPAGNPLRITDALRHDSFTDNQVIPNTRSFWYDPRYRLVRATGRKHASIALKGTAGSWSSPDPNDYEPYDYRYVYDEVGNFVKNHEYSKQVLKYKDSGDLDLFNGDPSEAGTFTSRTAGNWTYDANGNTTKTPRHNELRYTFDSQPHYVDMGGGGQVRYLRHSDQRVVRFVEKGASNMVLGVYLGPFEFQLKKNGSGVVWAKVATHLHGHGRHAEVKQMLDSTSDGISETAFYNHGDHLGSSGVLTKDDGSLLNQEEYFPYGRTSDRRETRNRYRYIGVERDDSTSLLMTGPRTMDAVSGRFLQPDKVLSNAAPFSYTNAAPTVELDSDGYSPHLALDGGSESAGDASRTRLGYPKSQGVHRAGAGTADGAPLIYTSDIASDAAEHDLSVTSRQRDFDKGTYYNSVTSVVTAESGQRQSLGAILGGERFDRNRTGDVPGSGEYGLAMYGEYGDCGRCVSVSKSELGFAWDYSGGSGGTSMMDAALFPEGHGQASGSWKSDMSHSERVELLNFVDERLYYGHIVPVMINYRPGHAAYSDGVSDHQAYIVGRGFENGKVVYYLADNSGGVQKLYVDSTTLELFKPGAQRSWQYAHDYHYEITNARALVSE